MQKQEKLQFIKWPLGAASKNKPISIQIKLNLIYVALFVQTNAAQNALQGKNNT